MKLTHATFKALGGCHVTINGRRANLQTKLSLLREGACSVIPVGKSGWEEKLLTKPVGQDQSVFGCDEPQLVELAMRYYDWSNDSEKAPWPETKVEVLPVKEALVALMSWLAAQGIHQRTVERDVRRYRLNKATNDNS